MHERKEVKGSVQYEQLQAGSLVTAAAIAHLTNPYVPQLILFKEATVEVWEVEQTKQTKVVNGVLQNPVSNCCVLQASSMMFCNVQAVATSMQGLDILLVTDSTGGLAVLEWNVVTMVLQETGGIEIVNPELQVPSLRLATWSVFSWPLSLPYNGSILGPLPMRGKSEEGGMVSKIQGTTLVAMHLYEDLLEVLSVEWTEWYPQCRGNKRASGVSGVRQQKPSLTPKLRLHFLLLQPLNSFTSPEVAHARSCIVKGLAFVGASEGSDQGALDVKRRPLLVVLFSQRGLAYHSLRLQCFALDLPTNQLLPGPWEIRNLHPTTTLLLPWSLSSNLELLNLGNIAEGAMETGLKPGLGVLSISSVGVLFIESSGRRISLSLNLDGMPSCFDALSRDRLVLGDSTGALYVLDISSWTTHSLQKISMKVPLPLAQVLLAVRSGTATRYSRAETCNQLSHLLFTSNQTGDSQLIFVSSCGCLVKRDKVGQDSAKGADISFKSHETPHSGEMSDIVAHKEELLWRGVELSVESDMLENLAPVRGMLLVADSKHSPDPFLLLACGTSPTSTLRKGNLVAPIHIDSIADTKLAGLPHLLPFHEDWDSQFHTHLLISHPVANVSEVLTIGGAKTADGFMVGLERGESTLAVSAMPGGWFIQITETSLRVLSYISSSRMLRAEWTPPMSTPPAPDLKSSHRTKIHHATLTSEGAVLVIRETVHSVQVDGLGVPHTVSTVVRPHQVSALGFSYVGDSCLPDITRELVVVVAQWSSNTVHLLSWPNLGEMFATDAFSAPVRSVAVGRLLRKYYLFAGTADGNLVHYKLLDSPIPTKRRNLNIDGPISHDPEELENRKIMRRLQGPDRANKPIDSLRTRSRKVLLPESDCPSKPQFKLSHGKIIKVGTSAVLVDFNGAREGTEKNYSSSSSLKFVKECLYVWSDRSLVLFPRAKGDFEVVPLQGDSHRVERSTRLHTEENPNGMIFLSKEGQLMHGYLELSIKLREVNTFKGATKVLRKHRTYTQGQGGFSTRWQTLKVSGTLVHLAYHKGSGCTAIISIGGNSAHLLLVHEVSMCQVLAVELEPGHLPSALSSLQLPFTCNQDTEPVECIILATQRCEQEHTTAVLSIFDLQATYSSEKEVQYKLQLLGLHPLQQPCHSLCMIAKASYPVAPLNCSIYSLDSALSSSSPWLRNIIQSITLASNHWSSCCSDHGLQIGTEVLGGPLLALGYEGSVELASVFVGASEACMTVVASVSTALDAAVIPIFGIHGEPQSDRSSEEETRALEVGMDDKEEAQSTPSVQLSSSFWETSSLINIRSLAKFATPGGGCVTSLTSSTAGNLLVAEMLHGLSVFQVHSSGQTVQLSWQPCHQPLQTVVPLSDDVYLLAMSGDGCLLMERNYAAEATYQLQEKLRLDLERETTSAPDTQDTTPQGTPAASSLRVEGVPCLTHVATASWSNTACLVHPGGFHLQQVPLVKVLTKSKLLKSLVTVTTTGEIHNIFEKAHIVVCGARSEPSP